MTTRAATREALHSPPQFLGWREDVGRMVCQIAVAALTPITILTLVLVGSPSVRFIVLCIAAAAVPGSAVFARASFRHPAAAVSLIVTASLTVDGCVAVGLLWARWYHPAVPAAVIGAVSSLRLLQVVGRQAMSRRRGSYRVRLSPSWTLSQPRAPQLGSTADPRSVATARHVGPRAWALSLAPLLIGFGLWIASLSGIDLSRVGSGDSGLLGIAPAIWYLSLVVVTAGTIREVWLSRSGWLVAAYLCVLSLIAIGTIPAVADAPQYSWVYKHIAITSLFIARGSVNSSVDIYNRWPAMFAFAGALTKLTGLSPIAYANWTQVVFTWLTTLLVYSIGFTITSRRRIASIAALMYLVGNWIGQIYFSPQTLAYALFLGFVLLVIGEQGRPSPSPLVSRVTGWLGRPSGGRLRAWFPPDTRTLGPEPLISSRLVVPLLIAIDFLVNATHQLTPYMLLIAYALMVLTRAVKGFWVWVACAVITLGYLAPNVSWLNSHYGLLNSFSLSSATGVTSFGLPSHRAALYAEAGFLIVFLLLVSAAIGCVVLLRRGQVQKMVLLLVMAVASALILGGQDYGGEGPLRVFFFSLPWQAVIIGFALDSLRARVAVALLSLITCGLVVLLLLTTAGNAAESVIPAGEVRGAQYINDHIRAGSALVTAGDNAVTKIGARYPLYAQAVVDDAPNLFDDQPVLAKNLSPTATALAVKAEILRYAKYGVIVFSQSQYWFAQVQHTIPVARLRAIQNDVSHSGDFKLWYGNKDMQVYELQKTNVFGG